MVLEDECRTGLSGVTFAAGDGPDIDKILILVRVRAVGDGQRLATGVLIAHACRASHVGYPHLERSKTLAAQALAVGANFVAGGLRAGGGHPKSFQSGYL
jgi:hypothetical protein